MPSGEIASILIVGVNVAIWLVIHLGSAYFTSWVKPERFNPDTWLYRTRRWEREGQFYAMCLGVKKWKDLLPDGARVSKKGFTKKRMTSRSPVYLNQFITETCRAELCHWLVIAAAPLFFLWNSWQIAILMLPYALAANMPCIVAQRYNRPRLRRAVQIRENGAGLTGSDVDCTLG